VKLVKNSLFCSPFYKEQWVADKYKIRENAFFLAQGATKPLARDEPKGRIWRISAPFAPIAGALDRFIDKGSFHVGPALGVLMTTSRRRELHARLTRQSIVSRLLGAGVDSFSSIIDGNNAIFPDRSQPKNAPVTNQRATGWPLPRRSRTTGLTCP
jgi:hypothetical protein